MDVDLIKLVNKLQDTFANLGMSRLRRTRSAEAESNVQEVNWTCLSWRS
jgi:hypothetical protein